MCQGYIGRNKESHVIMRKKNKVIGKQGEDAGYIIKTNSGIIHFDENGDWWLGGTSGNNSIALFGHREDAMRIAKKVRKQRPDLIRWTQTISVFYCVA